MNSKISKSLLFALPVFSVAGFLMRCYQVTRELLYDGSLAPGAMMHRILFALSVCILLGSAFVLFPLKKLQHHSHCFTGSPLANGLQLFAGGSLLAGNFFLWFRGWTPPTQYTPMSDTLIKLLPWLGMIAGICLLTSALQSMKGRCPSPILYMILSLYLVVRLIVYFQGWNTDPSIHDYAYQLLAAICTMLGCFQVAGFGFNKGKRRMTVFWCFSAVYFCAITSADLLESPWELMINLALLINCATNGLLLLLTEKEDPTEEEVKEVSEESEAVTAPMEAEESTEDL